MTVNLNSWYHALQNIKGDQDVRLGTIAQDDKAEKGALGNREIKLVPGSAQDIHGNAQTREKLFESLQGGVGASETETKFIAQAREKLGIDAKGKAKDDVPLRSLDAREIVNLGRAQNKNATAMLDDSLNAVRDRVPPKVMTALRTTILQKAQHPDVIDFLETYGSGRRDLRLVQRLCDLALQLKLGDLLTQAYLEGFRGSETARPDPPPVNPEDKTKTNPPPVDPEDKTKTNPPPVDPEGEKKTNPPPVNPEGEKKTNPPPVNPEGEKKTNPPPITNTKIANPSTEELKMRQQGLKDRDLQKKSDGKTVPPVMTQQSKAHEINGLLNVQRNTLLDNAKSKLKDQIDKSSPAYLNATQVGEIRQVNHGGRVLTCQDNLFRGLNCFFYSAMIGNALLGKGKKLQSADATLGKALQMRIDFNNHVRKLLDDFAKGKAHGIYHEPGVENNGCGTFSVTTRNGKVLVGDAAEQHLNGEILTNGIMADMGNAAFLADYLQRPVVVYSQTFGQDQVQVFDCNLRTGQPFAQKEPLRLHYVRSADGAGGHFMTVTDVKENAKKTAPVQIEHPVMQGLKFADDDARNALFKKITNTFNAMFTGDDANALNALAKKIELKYLSMKLQGIEEMLYHDENGNVTGYNDEEFGKFVKNMMKAVRDQKTDTGLADQVKRATTKKTGAGSTLG